MVMCCAQNTLSVIGVSHLPDASDTCHVQQVCKVHGLSCKVRDFQAVIGRETRRQCEAAFGGKPDVLLACVGGGSNAIGLFHEVQGLALGFYMQT